ncbi:hypothetical protein ERJ75_001131300 [Trypanosoma vivax]|nr:hypothetical protein ERJ75_001131600 [Trypanosoma vivax]KAH8610142.1 hypothetical protein ERJ75_001131300 [Trypanosoma vivax]
MQRCGRRRAANAMTRRGQPTTQDEKTRVTRWPAPLSRQCGSHPPSRSRADLAPHFAARSDQRPLQSLIRRRRAWRCHSLEIARTPETGGHQKCRQPTPDHQTQTDRHCATSTCTPQGEEGANAEQAMLCRQSVQRARLPLRSRRRP